jgi:hypothetical protein
MPACYCAYFGCSGQIIDDRTRKRHERMDISEKYHSHTQVCRRYVEFAQYLWLILFQPDISIPAYTNIQAQHLELEPQGSISKPFSQIDTSGIACEVEPRKRQAWHSPSIHILNPTSDSVTKILQSLVELEQRAASQTRAFQDLKSQALASPSKSLLKEIKTCCLEMQASLAALTALWCEDSSVAVRVKQDLRSKLQENIEDIRHLEGVLTNACTPAAPTTTRKVNGADKPGKVSIETTQHVPLMLAADGQFIRSLQGCSSFLQRSLFQVLVQDCLDHSTRRSSNFRLKSLKEDFRKTTGDKLSVSDEEFLKSFPTDIRVARKLLGIPKTITYACCPTCSSLYPPEDLDGTPTYPYECSSEPCQVRGGCNLLKLGSTPDRKSIGVPKRPFVMQDFHDFVGRLLSRPGVETAIQQSRERVCNDTVEDIVTADGVRAIKGPDGTPFLSGGQDQELRLLWCLSVDFFNPYHNKIAGKVASVGSIVLSCPLLPLSMRNRPENLCLVGIIPGPREPSGAEIDHFLRPLVKVMKESWAEGAIYKTHEYPHGRLVRSAIALSVNDLPMARKIMGISNYIDKNTAKGNFDSWGVRTLQRVQVDAQKWLNATSPKERKRLYNKTGVRHSVLMELEYWDPTSMVPVDGMHIFFIGLLQYHARTVLGMDSAGSRNEKVSATTIKQVQDARAMLHTSTESLDLKSLTVDVLKILCEERGINPRRFKGLRKEELIKSLKVCKRTHLTR